MIKQGILFRGLPVPRGSLPSFVREEAYCENSIYEEYVDITYSFLYALCQNVRCRSKIRGMKREWRNYLLKEADKSKYQGEYFWLSLGFEEYECARILLGMLEDIRTYGDERRERAEICLDYLISCGFYEERNFLKNKKKIWFRELCKQVSKEQIMPSMGVSRICIGLLLAEKMQVDVVKDPLYTILCQYLEESEQLWETAEVEDIEEPERIMENEEKKFQNLLLQKVKYPDCIFADIHGEKQFGDYLSLLFQIGGINKNVLSGEQISKEIIGHIVDMGKFQGEKDLESYVYSLIIVLLCRYLKKCLNKIKQIDHRRI